MNFGLVPPFRVLEVPDLTHEVNVELLRGWDQKEVGYLQMLRYIRISNADLGRAVVSRPGQHPRLVSTTKATTTATEVVPYKDSEVMDTSG